MRKSDDWSAKYDAAIRYYEAKDYYRSNTLLEEILPVLRGTEQAEYANFIFAYTYFYQDQYILAAHYFKTFVDIYSRSQYAMEATYMQAYSIYLQSPNYKLDQTSTYEAIDAMQAFINRYPYTDYAAQATEIIDELQVKLEIKAYESAKLYYKVERHKAALVAFDNFQKDYPDSKYNEEVLYLSIRTAYDYASVSIRSRQEERFMEAVEMYERFVDKYPSSPFLKDAEEIYADSIEELTKFAGQN